MSDEILVSHHNKVRLVTINREAARNAMDARAVLAIAGTLWELDRWGDVAAGILLAPHRHFAQEWASNRSCAASGQQLLAAGSPVLSNGRRSSLS